MDSERQKRLIAAIEHSKRMVNNIAEGTYGDQQPYYDSVQWLHSCLIDFYQDLLWMPDKALLPGELGRYENMTDEDHKFLQETGIEP